MRASAQRIASSHEELSLSSPRSVVAAGGMFAADPAESGLLDRAGSVPLITVWDASTSPLHEDELDNVDESDDGGVLRQQRRQQQRVSRLGNDDYKGRSYDFLDAPSASAQVHQMNRCSPSQQNGGQQQPLAKQATRRSRRKSMGIPKASKLIVRCGSRASLTSRLVRRKENGATLNPSSSNAQLSQHGTDGTHGGGGARFPFPAQSTSGGQALRASSSTSRLRSMSPEQAAVMITTGRMAAARTAATQNERGNWEGNDVDDNNDDADDNDDGNDDNDDEIIDDSWVMFRENSTLHGLRDFLLASSGYLRLVWLIIMLIALAFAFQGSASVLREYLQHRMILTQTTERATMARLPDVVMCPFNRFNRTFLESLNITGDLAQHLEQAFPSKNDDSIFFDESIRISENAEELERQLRTILRERNYTFSRFIKDAILPCEAFFEDPDKCINHSVLMTSSGPCYKIQGHLQSGADGYSAGMRLIIRLPYDLYHWGINQFGIDGIAVKLAEEGRGVSHDLTFIKAGSHSLFPLKATLYQLMNDPPYHRCRENITLNYSQLWCFEGCKIAAALRQCGCMPAPIHNSLEHARICTAVEIQSCFVPYFINTSSFEVLKKCKDKCLEPCTFWEYRTSVSSAPYPSAVMLNYLGEDVQKSVTTRMRSTIILDIFYEQLDYTIARHTLVMPFASVVAEIGGQVSLFLGCSVITVAQMIIYATRYSYNRTAKFVKRQSSRKRDSKFVFADYERRV